MIHREDAEALQALLLERVREQLPKRVAPILLALVKRSQTWGPDEERDWTAAVENIMNEILAEHLAAIDVLAFELPSEPRLQ